MITQFEFEMLECINQMWEIFCENISVDKKEAIQKFLDAKDRAHALLSFYCFLRPDLEMGDC